MLIFQIIFNLATQPNYFENMRINYFFRVVEARI